jgi:hypothetical protein
MTDWTLWLKVERCLKKFRIEVFEFNIKVYAIMHHYILHFVTKRTQINRSWNFYTTLAQADPR